MPSSACQKCARSEEHTSELQSHDNLVCRLLLEKKAVYHRVSASERSVIPAKVKGNRVNRAGRGGGRVNVSRCGRKRFFFSMRNATLPRVVSRHCFLLV